jgi:septal ring-binding cell division protein DamX
MTSQPKQMEKKQFITPTKVIIGVAILCILAMASYKVYTIAFPAPSENKMAQSHSKIISNAGSSSGRDTSSQTGSQSSRGTKTSDRPIGVAQTVGKDKISSNLGTGSDDDGE